MVYAPKGQYFLWPKIEPATQRVDGLCTGCFNEGVKYKKATEAAMDGSELIKSIIDHSGLPSDSLEKELNSLLNQANKTMDDLSLEDLRQILTDYLQNVFIEGKDHLVTKK